MNSNDLVNIPLVDLRGRTPSDLLRDRSDVARALIESASNTHGFVSRFGAKLLLPLADKSHGPGWNAPKTRILPRSMLWRKSCRRRARTRST